VLIFVYIDVERVFETLLRLLVLRISSHPAMQLI